jgi:glycosyltransferase involved in cell wall biosynthesis
MRTVAASTFTIVCNGASDEPPASGVWQFLVGRGAKRVTTVYHPLDQDDGPWHRIAVYEPGQEPKRRSVKLPSWPPATYAVDPFIPLAPAATDCWIGFNNLAAARGLVQRAARRAGAVVYWAVDFVPNRFGSGVLTRAYDRLDSFCCKRVDLRVELSSAALEGRNERHHLTPVESAPTHVAPVGVWLSRLPVAPEDGWKRKRVVFLGHLVPRQGVGRLIDALALLAGRGAAFEAEIAGRGPTEGELREAVARAGLEDRVRFVGFLSDHRDVEAFVARGSVAVAPYDTEVDSFTRFADPSKLRSYTAAGLPIVLTDVPPNAAELAAQAGAEVVPFSAEGIAAGIERALASGEEWQRRRRQALEYSKGFDWELIVPRTLEKVGFEL